jgi:hypothetical protein
MRHGHKKGDSMEYVEIEYEDIIRETDLALQLDIGDNMLIWIPKSQIDNHDEEEGIIQIPEWLAYEKSLI